MFRGRLVSILIITLHVTFFNQYARDIDGAIEASTYTATSCGPAVKLNLRFADSIAFLRQFDTD
jgi:hypothetical protein